MKNLILISLLLAVLIFSSPIIAQNYKIKKDHPDYSKIESNLLEGLKSDVMGLQFSSAFALGEIKSEKAVTPLINMLRNHIDENFRILAALSLSKIGTERSLFMVKRVGQFVDNPQISKFCDIFYSIKKAPLPDHDHKLVSQIFK